MVSRERQCQLLSRAVSVLRSRMAAALVVLAVACLVVYLRLPRMGDSVPAYYPVLRSDLRHYREAVGDYPHSAQAMVAAMQAGAAARNAELAFGGGNLVLLKHASLEAEITYRYVGPGTMPEMTCRRR